MPDLAAPLPDRLRRVAEAVFGDRLAQAQDYAELLATDGVIRGLIGPRETPRLWDRHILNCAAMTTLVPEGDFVVDVGSGAGLPGLVLAIARPDLEVALVEPLARRTAFLEEAVAALHLGDRVTVVRGRAEEVAANPAMFHVKPADVVTARAVAPLDRLAGWCLPLASIGGRLLAMKGSSAADEIAAHSAAIKRLGGTEPVLHKRIVDETAEPTYIVEVIRERASGGGSGRRQPSNPGSRRR